MNLGFPDSVKPRLGFGSKGAKRKETTCISTCIHFFTDALWSGVVTGKPGYDSREETGAICLRE